MTLEEVIALGKACLVEYEPTLNVLGSAEPHQGSPNRAIASVKGSLDSIEEKQMRYEICKVLDELAAVTHGFKMSEPDPLLKRLYKVDSVDHGNLNLTFVTMFDATDLEPITHIVCWYYPVE